MPAVRRSWGDGGGARARRGELGVRVMSGALLSAESPADLGSIRVARLPIALWLKPPSPFHGFAGNGHFPRRAGEEWVV